MIKISAVASVLFLSVMASPLAVAASKENTVNYYLARPEQYVGQEITLDVRRMRPTHWKCPNPAIQFFHVMTVNEQEREPGGEILVAVPMSMRDKFLKKYEDLGRGDRAETLKGTLGVWDHTKRDAQAGISTEKAEGDSCQGNDGAAMNPPGKDKRPKMGPRHPAMYFLDYQGACSKALGGEAVPPPMGGESDSGQNPPAHQGKGCEPK
jgi:hypothetical protein